MATTPALRTVAEVIAREYIQHTLRSLPAEAQVQVFKSAINVIEALMQSPGAAVLDALAGPLCSNARCRNAENCQGVAVGCHTRAFRLWQAALKAALGTQREEPRCYSCGREDGLHDDLCAVVRMRLERPD